MFRMIFAGIIGYIFGKNKLKETNTKIRTRKKTKNPILVSISNFIREKLAEIIRPKSNNKIMDLDSENITIINEVEKD